MSRVRRVRLSGLALSGAAVASAEASQRISQAACFFLLAAALSPNDFGLAAVAFLTLQVVNSLTYAGLGPAVQTLGPDHRRDRTALGMALVFGGSGAALMVATAPILCHVLKAPDATPLVQLIAVSLPISQFAEVKGALIERQGQFARTAVAQHVGSLVSASIGVGLALAGAGPVALVAQTLVYQSVRLTILQASRPHRIGVRLDCRSAREIWRIGGHLLGTAVMFSAYGNLDNAVVSGVSGPRALGGYGFVYNLANLPFYLVAMAANRVMLPTYAQRLRDGATVGSDFERAAVAVGLVTALPLGFLFVAGPDALGILFNHKWDYVATTLQVLVAFSFTRTVAATTVPVLISHGRVRQQRKAQQWLLALMVGTVVPATLAFDTVGTACAVTLPQVIIGWWLLREAASLTAARGWILALAVAAAAVAGIVAGTAGRLVLSTVPSWAGVGLAILATTGVWGLAAGAVYTALRRRVGPRIERASADAATRHAVAESSPVADVGVAS